MSAQRLGEPVPEAGHHSIQPTQPLPILEDDDVFTVVGFHNSTYVAPLAADIYGLYEIGRTFQTCSGGYGTWTGLGTYGESDVAIRLRTSDTPRFTPQAFLPTVPGGR